MACSEQQSIALPPRPGAGPAHPSGRALLRHPDMQRSAGLRAHVPTEIGRRIVEEPTLTRRDLLSLQLVNERLRSVVQGAYRRDLQLPTPLYGERQRRANTVAAWQQEVTWSKYAAILGRHRSLRITLRPNDVHYRPSGDALVIRTGNGRLVHAGLFDRSGLFCEIMPAGTLAPDDVVIDAKPSFFDKETWRLITTSPMLRSTRVWSCFADGTAAARELPDLQPLGTNAGWSAALSEDASHCVRTIGRRAQRILLGPADLPTLERSQYEFSSVGAICPATGRVLRVGPTNGFDVYDDDGLTPLFSFRVPSAAQYPTKIEVAPDGSRFAVHYLRGLSLERLRRVYGHPSQEGRWETFELPHSATQVARCYSTPWASLQRATGHELRRERPFCWSWDEAAGWQYRRPNGVSTGRYTGDFALLRGIQDTGQLMTLCFPDISQLLATQLLLFSGLSEDLERPLYLPPSRWQIRQYGIRFLLANAGPAIFSCGMLPILTFPVWQNAMDPTFSTCFFWAVFVPIACMTVGLGHFHLSELRTTQRTDDTTIDLRTAPLRPFVRRA